MATRYSDFISLQKFLPVYDIMDESSATWQSFIPTHQFNDMLRRALAAITSGETSKRKSLWVRGTFGTGKSHASAVVKHLLCDDAAEVDAYIDSITDASLKHQLRSIRKEKRYFSVTLKGVESAYDIPRFNLSLQRETQKALKRVAPDLVVKSDFATAHNWIVNHRGIFDDVLDKDEDLQDIVSSTEQVLNCLEQGDSSVYLCVEKALRNHIGSVLDHTGISDWLVEVEQEIERRGIADGLVIFWDEFTSVMDTLKSDRINVLQNIAEKSQNNNVFLFLISHRVEAQSSDTKGKDITKMSDRFDEIEYSMDTLSTYLIMRHSFTIKNEENNQAYNEAFEKHSFHLGELLDFVTDDDETQKGHIKRLFPMHPYTAYMCSTLSNFIGSSNRSVIKYMHDEKSGFQAFLDNEACYDSDMMMTVDTLWDFFYDDFDNDLSSTTFTNIFKSFEGKVAAHGEDYLRVFKAILLLNALTPKFKGDIEKLTPDDHKLSLIFAGDRISNHLTDILNFLNDSNIVVRNVFGQFKITGSSYNQGEMNQKRAIAESNFKTAEKVLNFNSESKDELLDLFTIGEQTRRLTTVKIFSCEEPTEILKSLISKFTSDKPNYLHVAFFLAIDENVRDEKMSLLKGFSSNTKDLVVVLAEESLSRSNHSKFVEAIATSMVAKEHFNTTEGNEYEKAARQFVSNWVKHIKNNTYTIYFNGVPYNENTVEYIPSILNTKISPKIFSKGFETVAFPAQVPNTFFTDKNCPNVMQKILQAQDLDQIKTHNGSATPIKWVFEQQNGNTLIKPNGELSEQALAGNAWLVEVCRHMDRCIDDAKKKYQDRFSLSDVLASFLQPPFGMFTSYANCAALAYAVRKHKADLFLPSTSQPVSDEALCDMLTNLFKMWKDGKTEHSNKMLLRFGSPEESKLTALLTEVFDLTKMKDVKASEIKSLDNAKWYVQKFCQLSAKQPLWTLTHNPSIKEDLKQAIREIIQLFEAETPSIEKIKSIYKTLTLNRMELNITLTNHENYEKGFVEFVESIEEAKIKKEWWNEMVAAVNTLQGDIAFRKESDVRQKIVKFYIDKTRPESPEGTPGNAPNTELFNPPKEEGGDGTTINEPDEHTVNEAKEKIKGINMPNMFWQKLALELLDEHPELSSFFMRI